MAIDREIGALRRDNTMQTTHISIEQIQGAVMLASLDVSIATNLVNLIETIVGELDGASDYQQRRRDGACAALLGLELQLDAIRERLDDLSIGLKK